MCVLCVQRLLRDLDLRCLTTPDLVLKFHQDLLDQCKGESEKKSRGVLTVSVAYLQYRKAVEVTVIAAKNLPGLDKSGELTLCVGVNILSHVMCCLFRAE